MPAEYEKEYLELDPHLLVPYERNPRLNDDAVDFVANSVEDFSFNDPIEVNEDYVILSGHTRLKAALKLGLEKVPVLVIKGMPESDQTAYRIAANKTQEKAGWDFDLLDEQVDALLDEDYDMERYGMDLSYLLDRVEAPEEPAEGPDMPEEEGQEGPCEAGSYKDVVPWVQTGDLVLLGPHRILCGDATSSVEMAKLMESRVADIAFTSPPYNAGCIGRPEKVREGQKYVNDADERPPEEYFSFLTANIDLLLEHSYEVFYDMGLISGSKRTIVDLLGHYEDRFKDIIYWQKSNPVPSVSKGVISSSTELILAFGRNGSRAFRKDIGIFYGVIQGTTVGFNPYREVHRATFPEYLPRQVAETFTDEGGLVLDCFLGTGTTLIACDDCNRRCYGMELEPLYVQIAVERYISHKGTDEDVKVIRNGRIMHYREASAEEERGRRRWARASTQLSGKPRAPAGRHHRGRQHIRMDTDRERI